MQKNSDDELARTTSSGASELNENKFKNEPASSNSRLEYQIMDFSVFLEVSIDRITVVGNLAEPVRDPEKLEELFGVMESIGITQKVSSGWRIVRNRKVQSVEGTDLKTSFISENVAFVQRLPFEPLKVRIDFNPNKLAEVVNEPLNDFIHKIIDEPHFSRVDVAFDVFGLPDEIVRQYQVIAPVSRNMYIGKGGDLESIYFGRSGSQRQIRMYDKRVERVQANAVDDIPDLGQPWWRIECQLRQAKANDWLTAVKETLHDFCSPFFLPTSVSGTERLVLEGLLTKKENWGLLNSKSSKAKYKKILREATKNDELTKAMFDCFDKSYKRLQRELGHWLRKININ